MAVATNKNEVHAHMVLSHFGIGKYFDIIEGSDKTETLQKQDIIRNVLSRLNIDNKETLMIGDAKTDLVGAKLSNIDFLAVRYGFGFRDDKSLIDNNIEYYVKEPIEILENIT